MQEEVEQKTVAFVVNGGKVTARTLYKMLKYLIEHMKKNEKEIGNALKKVKNPPIQHGKQSIKSLNRQNQGLTNIEITDKNIKCFEKYAKKYGVDFALKKDKTANPPKYVVFFKAKDTESLTSAFQDFTKSVEKKMAKPSVRENLRDLKLQMKKQIVAHELAKTLNKDLSKTVGKGGLAR